MHYQYDRYLDCNLKGVSVCPSPCYVAVESCFPKFCQCVCVFHSSFMWFRLLTHTVSTSCILYADNWEIGVSLAFTFKFAFNCRIALCNRGKSKVLRKITLLLTNLANGYVWLKIEMGAELQGSLSLKPGNQMKKAVLKPNHSRFIKCLSVDDINLSGMSHF